MVAAPQASIVKARSRVFAKQEPEAVAKPSPLTWIPDCEEKLQYSKDDNLRYKAARWFHHEAAEIRSFASYFAGTLALTVGRDSNFNVRKAAADALGALGSDAISYADTLAHAVLNDVHVRVREAAAQALAAVGKESIKFPQAKSLRRVILYDSQASVRRKAALALAVLDSAAAIPELDSLAARALAVVDVKATEREQDAQARETLEGTDGVVRSRAVAAFGEFGGKATPYSEMLATVALTDASVGVRLTAASVIGSLGDVAKPGTAQLVAALQNEDPFMRKAAVRALATIGYVEPPPSPPEEEVEEEPVAKPSKKKKKLVAGGKAKAAPKPKSSPRKPSKSPERKSSKPHESPSALTESSKSASVQLSKALSPSNSEVTAQEEATTKMSRDRDTLSPKRPSMLTSQAAGPSEVIDSPGNMGLKKGKKGAASPKRGGRRRQRKDESPRQPLPPPTPPPLARAGKALAMMALNDSDAFVRYRAGEAMSSFRKAVTEQVSEMAQTTLRDPDAQTRSRASEALGAMGDWRADHAKTFSALFAASSPRPGLRCSTAEIISQHRAVAALRDLGTAARPFRRTLDAVREGCRDPQVREAARRTVIGLENFPMGFAGQRLVSSPPAAAFPPVTNFASHANLRMEAAGLGVEARCSTAAGQRSEDFFFLRARML